MKQVAKLKRVWNLVPVLQIVQTILENYCSCLYLSIGQVCWPHEMWFKRHVQKSILSYTHHDVTDLVHHRMVKNTKPWISWKRNIIFYEIKKILNLCLRVHILRSYRFLAEVTFNESSLKKILNSKNKNKAFTENY